MRRWRLRHPLRTGRITPEADGTVEPAHADQEWARNTGNTPLGTRQRAVTARESSGETSPAGTTGGTSLLQARTVNEVVKARTNKVRLARMKG